MDDDFLAKRCWFNRVRMQQRREDVRFGSAADRVEKQISQQAHSTADDDHLWRQEADDLSDRPAEATGGRLDF